MTDNLDVKLFIKAKKAENAFLDTIIKTCLDNGSIYEEQFGGHSYPKVCLEEAKTKLKQYAGGIIYFRHEGLATYQLTIWPQESKKRKLGQISLSVYGGNFTEEAIGPKNAEELIKITKSIWNTLDEKPIYGFADDENHLPHLNEHPDDDILALDIPINRFWLNFYGKDMIEKFGEDALVEKEKGYRTEKLDSGLLVITDVVPTSYKGSWNKK